MHPRRSGGPLPGDDATLHAILSQTTERLGLLGPEGSVRALSSELARRLGVDRDIAGRELWRAPGWAPGEAARVQAAVGRAGQGEPAQIDVMPPSGRLARLVVRPLTGSPQLLVELGEPSPSPEAPRNPGWVGDAPLQLQADVLEVVGDAVLLLDAERRVRWMNRAAAELYGVPAGPWGELPLDDVFRWAWPTPGMSEADVDAALARTGRWCGRLFHIRRDGARLDVEVLVTGLVERDEPWWVLAVRDLTELRQAEQALARSEERFRRALAASRGTVYAADARTDELLTFSNVDRIVGAAPPPGVRRSWWLERLHPDDRARTEATILEAAAAGEEWAVAYRVQHEDGRWLEMVEHGTRAPGHDGDPDQLVGFVMDVTARRDAERALRRQRDELGTILHSVPVALAVLDRDLRIQVVSAPMAALAGVPEHELQGCSAHDVFPDVASRVEGVMREVFASGQAVLNHELRVPDPAPEAHTLRMHFHPVREGPEVRRLVVVVEDVTVERREEREQWLLADLAEHFRIGPDAHAMATAACELLAAHLQASCCSLVDLDADGALVGVVGQGGAVVGDGSACWPDPADLHTPGRSAELAGGHTVLVEDARLLAEGDPLHAHGEQAVLVVPCLRDGELVAALAASRPAPRRWRPDEIALCETVALRLWNAVEADRAWDRVRESEQRLRAITDEIPALIAYLDDAERFQFANAPYEAWFGIPRDDIEGRRLADVLPPDAYAHARPYALAALAGRAVRFENEIRTADGRLRAVLAAYVPRTAEDGRVVGFYSLLTDITDRKQAERALRESRRELAALNATLEERVRERTAQVRALSAALTLAEQRERRRLSQVLHDELQQMLFGLGMRVQLLKKHLALPDDAPAGQQIDHLQDLVRRAVAVTRSISIELNPPTLRSQGLEASLSWLSKHMRDTHGLQVELDVPDELHLPGADQRALVVQLVRELLFNVVRHAGVQRAVVRARRDDHELRVEVEDEGRGFDPAEAMSRQRRQDALGLFSVEERLRLFGGELEVDSRPGDGARILIRMPIRDPDAPTPP